MKLNFNVIQKFWKDIKELQKKNIKVLQTDYPADQFLELSEGDRIESIPVLNAVKNTIENTILDNVGLDAISDKIDQQPFIKDCWILRKMRYAIDNTGKSGGLRLIFAVNDNGEGCEIIFVMVGRKKDVAKEQEFRQEFFGRFKQYLGH